MTFAAILSTVAKRNTSGKLVEKNYTFTAESGDTGGTIVTGIAKITEMTISGELADGSANLTALAVGLTGTAGTIRVSFTDPEADAKGRITVRGRINK